MDPMLLIIVFFATICYSYSVGFKHFSVKKENSIYIFLHCTFYSRKHVDLYW